MPRNPPSPGHTPPVLLTKPLRISIATILAFGLFMQILLILGVSMADRTLDRGVAPMQELLLIQRQTSQALLLVKRQDQLTQLPCNDQGQNELCEVPLLLKNVVASTQRLLNGEGGLAGLPRSQALQDDARTVALQLRDQATELQTLSTRALNDSGRVLLDLQRGLLDLSALAHRLEQHILGQLQNDFRTKRWLDGLAIIATGVLMTAVVVTLFWMWSRVRNAFSQVHTSEARLRAYTDAVPDPVYVLDSEGRVLEAIGHQHEHPGQLPPLPVGDLVQQHRPAALSRQYLQTIHQALSSRQVQTLESELTDTEGRTRWFEARVAAIEPLPTSDAFETPPQTPLDQVIWLSRDVTERIRNELALRQLNEELEARVEERTRELNDAAEELRRFNYTVSHDLRAPLRAVEAYTALAVEEAGDSLSPVARDLLERARKSAHQLAQMVESLLNLSRIGEIPLQRSWLDLSAMANEICMAFGIDQKDHRIEWQLEPGMTVWADEHLVRSLLQNLISNAVKYSAHRQPASIKIGQSPQADGSTAFYVRDNGAGFDMAHATQLFQPFTRLHSAREFPGDGIGLATVRRIVKHHGGRVWAQGQIDVGATIFFTLPGQPPPRERDFIGSRPAPLDHSNSRPAPLGPDIES
ncbi:PAS domain-containing protein [Hydrogenophaga aromaticivorans]|uniref:sensor histidine kinase n=1 Tax=Hydrogenophaga aromaticivorans TaxID=2610898 RepID=UPI001B380696|nr:ATP-binding protein [Hydrogenophaga aromaticivorans]MBQ0918990.1 PAS domain-containing protein [Hydrogenophaga aromaticivorans]